MTTDFRALCVELTDALDKLNCSFNVPNQSGLVERARAALAEPEPVSEKSKGRACINNPVQIAECGGPCLESGPEACDCGALWRD